MPMVYKEKLTELRGLRKPRSGVRRPGFQTKRRLFLKHLREPRAIQPRSAQRAARLGACARTCAARGPAAGAEQSPPVAAHPQRFTPDSQHRREFLFAVAVLVASDELGD